MLAYPAYLGLQYRKLPPIHDITTDPIDPPRFDALARLRTGDGANPAVYAGLYSAEQQRIAYPDIETVELEVPVQRAYEITLQLVTKRKWLVIDERAPQPPRRIGRIEAVARTPIMGFREDVSIRVTPDGEDSRVDIRSASRYFESDLGSNAARVRKLIDDINNAVDNANLKPAVKKPPVPAKLPPKVGEEVTSPSFRGDAQRRTRNLALQLLDSGSAPRGASRNDTGRRSLRQLCSHAPLSPRGQEEAASRYVPPITGSPSVATIPRPTRSSRCASTE